MAPSPTRGSAVPGAPWRACQYASVTNSGRTFTVDGDHDVVAITFYDADSALTSVTVTIVAENTIIYSAVPIVALGVSRATPQAVATGGSVVWMPPRPIRFNPNWPITITPSATTDVVLHGSEALTA